MSNSIYTWIQQCTEPKRAERQLEIELSFAKDEVFKAGQEAERLKTKE